MSWEMLALAVAVFYGLANVILRTAMKKEDSLAFTWIYEAVSTIIFFALFVREFSIPLGVLPWLIALAGGILWTAAPLFSFKSYQLMDVSARAPLGKVSILLVLLMSVIFLGETLTSQKIIGTFLIFLGAIILVLKGRKIELTKGVKTTFLAVFLSSIAFIVDKVALNYFLPAVYGFLVYLLPSILLMPLASKKQKAIKNILRRSKKALLSVILLDAIGYFTLLNAFKITDVSNVIPVIQLSSIVAILGGYYFHKEQNIAKRLLGAVVMIAGSILILRPGLF